VSQMAEAFSWAAARSQKLRIWSRVRGRQTITPYTGVGGSNPSPPTGKALVKDHGARAGLHRLFPQAVSRPRIEPISFESKVPACAERPGRPNAGTDDRRSQVSCEDRRGQAAFAPSADWRLPRSSERRKCVAGRGESRPLARLGLWRDSRSACGSCHSEVARRLAKRTRSH
jgi:hypothetical protein